MAGSLDHSSILHTYLLYVATVHTCDWIMGIKACAAGSWMESLHSNGVTTLRVLLQIQRKVEEVSPLVMNSSSHFSHRAWLSHILAFYAVKKQSLLFIALRDGTQYFGTSNYFCRLKMYELHSFLTAKPPTKTTNNHLHTRCSLE